MAIPKEAIPQLSDRFAALLPHLNERQRRLALGVEARLLGHGGVGTVARVAKVSETTVRRGIAELAAGTDACLTVACAWRAAVVGVPRRTIRRC